MTEIAPNAAEVHSGRPSQELASHRRAIGVWLYAVAALVAAMVLVGGATRLTDSGLSITEWRPVTGAMPPLSQEAWDQEFEKYRQIPEYQYINRGMSLAEFKAIYWWEWGHRFLGRLIGVVFFAPFVWFLIGRRLDRPLFLRLLLIFGLGAGQGLLGWYMVKSGLVERVDVSAARLAAHLSLALIIFALTLQTALGLTAAAPRRPRARFKREAQGAIGLAILVFFQMALGALVAGNLAGRIHTSWPLMDGGIVPAGYFALSPAIANFFENPSAVQFNHRIGAYLVVAAALLLWGFGRANPAPARLRALRVAVIAAVGAQVALGVVTLLNASPLPLALAHQAVGLVLFTVVIVYAQAAQRIYSGR
ncbi:MAG: COX15/CtaA family protein [Parvularculaceae bacterium]